MKIPFYKYQGTGNDFILVDQREEIFLKKENTEAIRALCDRHFGIGADGLILLQNHPDFDFEMVYFNADGNESSMCGNGGRCIAAFAKKLGVIDSQAHFLAIDGPHNAIVKPGSWVELKMSDVEKVDVNSDHFILNTGSPHYVTFVKSTDKISVNEAGAKIRYQEKFGAAGINVNFVEDCKNAIKVATYERGVENETLSCGTGVTAAAIAYSLKNAGQTHYEIPIHSKGGDLLVKFATNGKFFFNIWLCGPAALVFEGAVDVDFEI